MSAERQRYMQPGTHPPSGPVTRFLEDDHRRLEKLRAGPAVAVLPHSDTPAVLGAVRRALERAKYEYLSDSMRF